MAVDNKTGALESEVSLQDALKWLFEEWKTNGDRLHVSFIENSKHHHGQLMMIVGDGDPAIEISAEGVFCYAWSGAS